MKGLGQLKNPLTSLGMKPTNFQLVAQCLNQPTIYEGKGLKGLRFVLMVDIAEHDYISYRWSLLYKS
jgi:hypothetical protein